MLLLYDRINLETFAPCKYDLYESLITWGSSPAKKINDLLSAEWKALTFGHRQGERIKHRIRSLENRRLFRISRRKIYFALFFNNFKRSISGVLSASTDIIKNCCSTTHYLKKFKMKVKEEIFSLVICLNQLKMQYLKILLKMV